MNTTIKPIIGRVGGKWRISKWVIEHIKRFDWSLYVEPFCGSAAIYFQLLNDGIPEKIKARGHHPRFVLNDMDSRIIDLYRCCRDFPELLAYAIYFTPYSREEHKLAQKGEAVDDLIEMCQRYLVLGWQGFAKQTDSDWGIAKNQTSESGGMKDMISQGWCHTTNNILFTSHHLGEKFTELKQGIDQIEDETFREQSKQALDAILSEFQKSIETDIRVEFVRRFLTYEYQERKGRHFEDDKHSYWAIENNDYDNKHQPTNFCTVTKKLINSSPHLQEISDLKKVYLENDDFEKVCRRWDTPHSLHYLDPPYFDKEDYYAEKFTKECHQRLCQMAHELEGQVIISYYPHPDILAMYSEDDWEHHFKESVASSCGVTRTSKTKTRPKRMELLLVRKRRNTDKTIIDLAGQLSLF
jgi:site-specific DNA-adenine methylase